MDYVQLRDLCSNDPSLECEWKVWREKAKTDFGVTERFFDLVRTISGAQRYLQVQAYYKLTPNSATRVYKDSGYIEGVYTSLSGYLKAQERQDSDMAFFFYSRLKEHEKSLVGPPSKARREEPSSLLYDVLSSGQTREIDAILSDYFTLPQGFSIEKDILEVPFWEEPPLYNIPLWDEVEDKQEIMYAALVGLNPKVVDFFRSLFRNQVYRDVPLAIYQGLLRHGKAEQAYSLALRFPEQGYNYMTEMLINPNLNSLQAETFLSALDQNPGNITMLTALLPYISKNKVRDYYSTLEEEWKLLYPLPDLILQEYIRQEYEG